MRFKNRVLLSLLLAVTLGQAGERVITLNNGKQLTAKTIFGSPVHEKNEFLTVYGVRPIFENLEGWRKTHLNWRLEFSFKKACSGMLIVDNPMQDGNPFHIAFENDRSMEEGNWVTYVRLDLLAMDEAPLCWEWLNEPGDSWIPFHLVVQPKYAEKPTEFMEWSIVTEAEKAQLRGSIEKLKRREEAGIPCEAVMPDGRKLPYRALKGRPVRFADNELQIDNLSPAVRVDKQNKNAKTLVWVLQGRHRGTRESVLKLTAPWLDKAFSHTVKIRSHGPFTFAFAAAPEHPGFWRWQEGDAEQWLAVQAELTSVDSQTTHAFNEFVHIDPAFRKEFQELVAK